MAVISKIEDVEAFLAVAAQGSFVGAARSLGIDAALVSKRVTRLERHLGARLLARTTRRVSVTEAGQVYASHATQALMLLETAHDETHRTVHGLSGPIRMAAPTPFGRKYVAPCIAAFCEQHPGVEFDLSLSDQIVDLLTSGFDMAVRIGDLPASSLVTRRLATDRQILCASPAYLEREGTAAAPGHLTEHNCLLFTADGRSKSRWTLQDDDGRMQTVDVTGSLQSDSGESLRSWAIAGHGISLRSAWDVVNELRSGVLVHILPAWEAPPRPIHLLRPHRHAPRRITAFTDFLVQWVGNPPLWEQAP